MTDRALDCGMWAASKRRRDCDASSMKPRLRWAYGTWALVSDSRLNGDLVYECLFRRYFRYQYLRLINDQAQGIVSER